MLVYEIRIRVALRHNILMRWPNPYLCIMVLCWGFNFVAVKAVYSEISAPAVALLRFFLMSAILVGLSIRQGESLRFEPGDAPRLLFAGFLTMGLYMVLFMEGMRLTTPAEGAIVLATMPIFAYLMACVARQERFRGVAFAGGITAFLGVATVILGGASGSHGSIIGNLVILASSVVWAFAAVFSKPILVKYSPLRFFTLSMVGGFPVMLIYGTTQLAHTDLTKVDLYGWGMFLHIAVLSGVVAFLCFYEGVRKIGAGRSTMYQYFVPPTAVASAFAVFGKTIVGVQWLGMVIVLAGVLIAGLSRNQLPKTIEA